MSETGESNESRPVAARTAGDPSAATGSCSDELVVRAAMGQLYGASAALIRGDRAGAEVLLADMRHTFDSVTEVLVTISIATLERLEFAFRDRSLRTPERPIASELIAMAVGYHVAPARAVHAAAWRLDSVRCNDRSAAAEDVRGSRPAGTDGELTAGAVALLAAAIELGATSNGGHAEHAARQLCLAVSLGPVA